MTHADARRLRSRIRPSDWRLVPCPELPPRWFAVPLGGQSSGMRFGNVEVRPLGGGLGCLFMVLFSVVASVVLTVLANLLLR